MVTVWFRPQGEVHSSPPSFGNLAIISLNSVNQLIFATDTRCVYLGAETVF